MYVHALCGRNGYTYDFGTYGGDATHATGSNSTNITVNKATLSVNADPASKTYGDADPAFTYTFSGFQFSDNAGNSSITGTGSCSRTPGQSVAGSALHDHLHPRRP